MYSNLNPYVINVYSQRPLWNAASFRGLHVRRTQEATTNALFWTGTQFKPLPSLKATHLEGLTIVNNSTNPNTHIDVTPGYCVTTVGGRYAVQAVSSLTKNLEATWAPGNNNGGRFNSVSLTDSTYHFFLIFNPQTKAIDAGFDSAVSGTNIPTGWVGRRLGSIRRVSGAIELFNQIGAYFQRKTVAVDLNSIAIPTTGADYTLSIPVGKSMLAHGNFSPGATAINEAMALVVHSPNKTSFVPNSSPATADFKGTSGSWLFYDTVVDYTLVSPNTEVWVPTNSNAQAHFRRTGNYAADVNQQSTFQTLGWYDLSLLEGL